MQPTRSTAIKRFLDAKARPDLADLYDAEMECQVNVARDGGDRVGDYKGWRGCTWTDGVGKWYPIRIPKHASTEPEDNGHLPMTYSLEHHAQGIGLTGWNFKEKTSQFVAFDFDGIVGHSDKHTKKLDEQTLAEVQKTACAIPWVTVRKSSGGKGLHLYVFLNDIPTVNHHEHAALARAILGIMSAEAGFDFCSKVDICGGNMWIWHRKCIGNDGFELIKAGVTLDNVPPNWRDHVKVVKGTRKKNLPAFIENQPTDMEALFDEMTGQRPRCRLDKTHQQLIEWLRENDAQAWWDSDHHMLVTHTHHLHKAHDALNLIGVYDTMSKGTEAPNDHNCFLFPMRRGAWVVRRFSPGVNESDTWDQDGAGWTRCYLNRDPDLQTAARSLGAIENEKGGYVFRSAEIAEKAANLLGANISVPGWAGIRPAVLRQHKDGRLIFEIEHTQHDPSGDMRGWLQEKKVWKRIFQVQAKNNQQEVDAGIHDDMLRHVTTPKGDDAGWVVRVESRWACEPLAHIKPALKAMGYPAKEIEPIIGSNIFRPWTLVNEPFQPEYPGDRKWNRDAAQLAFLPSEEPGDFPSWRKVLAHIGSGLDDALVEPDNWWFKANDIKSGEDYLLLWIASMFQHPTKQLPYLFLYGSQNAGKSILHEALGLLMTRGVRRADNALRKGEKFNAELEGGILCVIEEAHFKNDRQAYNKIKDWVTSLMISIHRKNCTPYEVVNTGHYVHCANEHDAAPIFDGDSRITMVHVPALEPQNMIPKEQLMQLLRKEAPFFLEHILNLDLPPSNDRLNVPIIETSEKLALQRSNQDALQRFLEDMCYDVPGETIPFGTFWMHFQDWVDPTEADFWSKIRVSKKMPPHFPCGNPHGSSTRHIGNISFSETKSKGPRLKLAGIRLVPQREG